MNKKNRIRLTESDLHRIIKESVKGIIREMSLHSRKTGQVFNVDNDSAYHANDHYWADDGDLRDSYMWGMREDARRVSYLGVYGWPTGKWLNDNYDHYFRFIHFYGGELYLFDDSDRDITSEDFYKFIDHCLRANRIGWENIRSAPYEMWML